MSLCAIVVGRQLTNTVLPGIPTFCWVVLDGGLGSHRPWHEHGLNPPGSSGGLCGTAHRAFHRPRNMRLRGSAWQWETV